MGTGSLLHRKVCVVCRPNGNSVTFAERGMHKPNGNPVTFVEKGKVEQMELGHFCRERYVQTK